jgi:hypothetical protein
MSSNTRIAAITISGTGPTLKEDDEDERFPPCAPGDVGTETDPFLEKGAEGCIPALVMLCTKKERGGCGRCDEEPGEA